MQIVKSKKNQSPHAKLAYNAINEYLRYKTTKKTEKLKTEKIFQNKQACFVTLKTKNKKLRGCIGTLYPAYKNLKLEIINNAVASAVQDSRFNKLTINEFSEIIISVEVLSTPEKISSIEELNPQKYGVIVSDGKYRRGVLLPNIEGINTVKEQINIAKRKAGIYYLNNKELELYRFTTEKFY